MKLSEIEADLFRRLNFAATPATEVTTRIRAFVNIAHRQILATPGLDRLRDDTITLASVANQPTYGLPPALAIIQIMTDRTTMLRLQAQTLSWVRSVDPGLVQTGPSTHYVPLGIQAVALQPSNASELFVKSTSASDTNTAYLEGIRTGGYPRTLSVTMTGTTGVTFSATTTDLIEVTKFYLSAAAVGTVTLLEDSGAGTELARIPIGQTFSRYQGLQLWPTPQSAITYYLDYTRNVPDLVNANDEPLLPDDFHWLLVEGALINEWTKQDDDRRADARAAYRVGLNQLKYRVTCPPDWLPSRTGRPVERSRFGGNFPATHY